MPAASNRELTRLVHKEATKHIGQAEAQLPIFVRSGQHQLWPDVHSSVAQAVVQVSHGLHQRGKVVCRLCPAVTSKSRGCWLVTKQSGLHRLGTSVRWAAVLPGSSQGTTHGPAGEALLRCAASPVQPGAAPPADTA